MPYTELGKTVLEDVESAVTADEAGHLYLHIPLSDRPVTDADRLLIGCFIRSARDPAWLDEIITYADAQMASVDNEPTDTGEEDNG